VLSLKNYVFSHMTPCPLVNKNSYHFTYRNGVISKKKIIYIDTAVTPQITQCFAIFLTE